jgi:Fe-S oxidoreductase
MSALRQLFTYGLLQRKVLERPYAGVMHVSISSGFVVLFLGSVLLALDTHALRPLGVPLLLEGAVARGFQATLDAFGLLLILGVLLALRRRLWRPARHLRGDWRALGVLLALLFLALSGFALEGLRMAQQHQPADRWAFAGLALSGWLADAGLSGEGAALVHSRLWWSHAIAAAGLLAAIPYTGLRHALFAPAHILRASPRPSGALRTPFNLQALVESGDFDVQVGARTVEQLGPAQRRALLACTGCARCEEACPAHATGTALSPRLLVQGLRAAALRDGATDLFEGTVSPEALWACTLCAACSVECPVLIQPTEAVVELRRSLVSEGRLDRRQAAMLAHLASGHNPFGLPHAERTGLGAALGVPTLAEEPGAELLYWPGCAATYDARARRAARATVQILKRAGVRFAILGAEERCCGDPARRLGEEGRFQELLFENLETLGRHGVRKVLTQCAHCFNTFRNEYPGFGADFETVHHAAFLRELAAAGRIRLSEGAARAVTLHDSCSLGRLNRELGASRGLLRSVPRLRLLEMSRSRERSFCCGGGGAGYWYDVPRSESMGAARIGQALETGARVVAVECPYCLRMLEDAVTARGVADEVEVRDVAEIVAEALG